MLLGKKVKIVLNMQVHFEEIIIFFGRKVHKVPCIIVEIRGKFIFLGIFAIKIHWIIGLQSQNIARYAGAFWGKNHYLEEK